MEPEDDGIPGEPAVLQELPAAHLLVGDDLLVRHLQDLARQDVLPVLHDLVRHLHLVGDICAHSAIWLCSTDYQHQPVFARLLEQTALISSANVKSRLCRQKEA